MQRAGGPMLQVSSILERATSLSLVYAWVFPAVPKAQTPAAAPAYFIVGKIPGPDGMWDCASV